MKQEIARNTPYRIIVRMPNWLGDAVMATPILEDLKNTWPYAHLTVLCQKPIAILLENNPYIDELLVFSKLQGRKKGKESKKIIRILKDTSYDLGILLTNSLSSAWQFFWGKVKRRIGYKKNLRSFLMTDSLPFPSNYETQHLVISYKQLLAPLNIPVSSTSPKLYISSEEKAQALERLQHAGSRPTSKIIGINPGAAYGSAKCWLPERFKELTHKLLQDPDTLILYFGDSLTKPLVDSICTDFPDRVINFAGKTTIRELIALIASCHLFITNDSGPMHIAAALKTPLVALFGSTNEIKTGPYQFGQVIHKHVSCSPCYRRECPIDFRCMTSISVDDVLKTSMKALALDINY